MFYIVKKTIPFHQGKGRDSHKLINNVLGSSIKSKSIKG